MTQLKPRAGHAMIDLDEAMKLPLGAVPAFYADRLGDRPAIIHGDAVMSWKELERASNRFANAMLARGVQKDDRVALVLPNCNELFALAFGIWKVGATPTTIAGKTPAGEMRGLLEVIEPRLAVFGNPALAAEVGGVTLDFADLAPETPVALKVTSHWKAIPSGGSTGRPKIIVARQPADFPIADSAFGLPLLGAVLNPGPLYHNGPFGMMSKALQRGNLVVSMVKFDPEEALRLIEKYRAEFVAFVPTMMHRIWRLPPEVRTSYDLSSLKRLWHIAAPMPAWLKREWMDWLGPSLIWELYGGTENTGKTRINGEEWLRKPGSVGRPFDGAEVRIQDESGKLLGPNEIGEVFLMPTGGTQSTYFYLGGSPRLDKDGWDSLGDYGYMDEDGYLFLSDRRTDMILCGGANVYPAEVEAALVEHPQIDDAVVIGLPDADLGARVHAVVRVSPGAEPQQVLSGLAEWLGPRLARYKIPRSFEETTEGLRDDAGKIRRSALRAARIGPQ